MKIDSIVNGIVIDHIAAGRGMQVYHLLNLDKLDCSVAIIKNVHSKKMGRKDIIKVDAAIDLDIDAIGYVVNNNTVVNGINIHLIPPPEVSESELNA